jgi:hypothetical protein
MNEMLDKFNNLKHSQRFTILNVTPKKRKVKHTKNKGCPLQLLGLPPQNWLSLVPELILPV